LFRKPYSECCSGSPSPLPEKKWKTGKIFSGNGFVAAAIKPNVLLLRVERGRTVRRRSDVGDGKGRVGYGSGKAREVPEAIRKATEQARKSLIRVPLREGRTLHHDIESHYGAGHVIVRTAPQGAGIIAGGPMRAIFEALGVKDVVAKSVGTSNPHNMIKATFEALTHVVSPRSVAARRGKKVSEILGRRDGVDAKE